MGGAPSDNRMGAGALSLQTGSVRAWSKEDGSICHECKSERDFGAGAGLRT